MFRVLYSRGKTPERPNVQQTLSVGSIMLDEFDHDAEAVVPVSMMPTPQVISSGGSSSGAADTQCRAAAYNERMARARESSKKTGSAGAHA